MSEHLRCRTSERRDLLKSAAAVGTGLAFGTLFGLSPAPAQEVKGEKVSQEAAEKIVAQWSETPKQLAQ
jgi:hypothetical protein